MKVGDITYKTPTPEVKVDTTDQLRVCTDCHDLLGTAGGFRLYGQIPVALADGTISSNDPAVQKPFIQVPLSSICADINAKIPLATGKTKDKLSKAYQLCVALSDKEH